MIIDNNAPIGVFDSGVGGLTVVRELMQQLPGERIVYYGDTARVPYGNKSPETIIKYSAQIAQFLCSLDVKAIIIACNTASAIALEELKKVMELPILGVVKPGAKAAADATVNNRIGVIATRATINSGIYEDFLRRTNPEIKVYGQACPLFVPLVEEGFIDDPITDQVIHRYLDDLVAKDIDALVLGCTHYPLLRDRIKAVVGDKVRLVNPAYETAKSFKYLLEDNNLLNTDDKCLLGHSFYVSDSPESFRSFAASVLGFELDPNAVMVKAFD